MTTNTLLHPQTAKKVKAYLKRPTHALLITGEEGSGKFYLASQLAKELDVPELVVTAEEGKSSITIDQIRTLYSLTKTGTRLIVVLHDAQQLTREAQNAFLKLLEEPPKSVRFILTASKPEKILPTIRSRSQELKVVPPGKNRLLDSVQTDDLSNAELMSLAHTSRGLAGLFVSALNDPELRSDRKSAIDEAKQFYLVTPYQRHLICIEHSYEKNWSEALLAALALILESLLKTSVSDQQTKTLLRQAALVEETARNLLTINGNPKIHLARLAQQL